MIDRTQKSIAIERVAYYLPDDCYSLEEYMKIAPAEFSMEKMQSIWRDIAIEPEILYRYFNDEAPAANANFALLSPVEVAQFQERSGISRVYCASDENSSDMALRAGRQIMAQGPSLAAEIDALICYHSTINESASWSTACRLQYELGLKKAFAFSISQKSGNASLMALKVACEMLEAEPQLNSILLVGCEKLVPPYKRVFARMTVMSDSASAMIVRRGSRGCRPLCFKLRDYAEWWNPYDYDAGQIEQLVEFLAVEASLLLSEVLEEIGAGWDDVALVIPPNFSLSLAQSLSLKAGIDFERIYTKNISRFGYLTTSDLAVNLSTVLSEQRAKPGDLVLVLNLGLGLSLGCVALEVGEGDD